jgi:hypothetical protein
MPSYPPSAEDLLAGVSRTLKEEILPAFEGFERFHVRVAIAMVDLVRRDASGLADRRDGERQRLQALLQTDTDDLDALNGALKTALREGGIAWHDPALLAHVEATVSADLAVDNPRWFRD